MYVTPLVCPTVLDSLSVFRDIRSLRFSASDDSDTPSSSEVFPEPCSVPHEPAKGVLRFRGRVSVSSVCFWFFPRVPALRSHARVFWHAACVTLQASLVRLACDSSSIPAASAADAALSLQTVRCALSSSLTAGRGVPGGRARGD